MVDRPEPAPTPLSAEDAALLETLPDELARALFPERDNRPFTITVVYPELGDDVVEAATQIEERATAHSIEKSSVEGQPARRSTTFTLRQLEEFHELYHLVEKAVGADRLQVLLNGRAVPLTRELWLPLIWELRK